MSIKEKIYEKLAYKRFFRTLIQIHNGLPKINGKSYAFDYFITRLFSDISLEEYYYGYRFYRLKRDARRSFFSNDEAHRYEALLNGVNAIEEFKNKACFNRLFSLLIHRKWVYLPDVDYTGFINLVKQVNAVIFKPNDSSMGRGVFKMRSEDVLNKGQQFFLEMQSKKYLCEECIVSCDEIQKIHPASLNTIRVTTLRKNNRVDILWAFIRIGRNGSVVDNGHSGGLFAMINPENGLIYTPGTSIYGEQFCFHPNTGEQIIGMVIPCWQEVVRTAVEAANMFPAAVISGWDIALLADGKTELIEGNSKPDIDMVQAAVGYGIKDEIIKRVTCKKEM